MQSENDGVKRNIERTDCPVRYSIEDFGLDRPPGTEQLSNHDPKNTWAFI